MKSFLRTLKAALLISFILISPVSTVYADSLQGPVPNPDAEAYLLAELRASGEADLQYDFSEGERVIRGEILLQALNDPQVQSKPVIYIAHATIAGDLDANDLHIPANLSFEKMIFGGLVNFSNAQFPSLTVSTSNFVGDVDFNSAAISGYVDIQDNTFQKNLIFTRTALSGNADLRENVISGSLNFYGAHISGELLLDWSKVMGTEPLEDAWAPVEFWSTTIDGPASFLGVHFEGEALFDEANFNRLNMSEATFSSDVSFSETIVDSFADFSHAEFAGKADFTNFYAGNTFKFNGSTFHADAIFENATAVRMADFSDVTFNGMAKFDYFTTERFIDFINTTFNQSFSFYYTTVAWPYFDNATFNGPVKFEGMQASQDFEIANTRYNYKEPLFAYLVKVEGAVRFTSITAPAGIVLSQGHFGNLSISTKNNPEIATIDLTGTDIEGQLTIENVNMQSFLAEGATIGKSTTLNQVNITKNLDMRNAHIGFFRMDTKPKWPHDANAFNLRGMTYTDIDLGNRGLTEETWQGVLELLDQASYSPQSYQAFGQFLGDKGHPDWAAEVDLAQKRRERDEALKPLSGAWFWSWFLDIFVGYGHRPDLAFIWSGLVIVIGAFIFRRQEDMLPVEQDDAKVEYNPIWYSFALFIPYVDLGIAAKWEPNPARKWARYYKYIHMLLGWILAPIALLTFSGIIG